MTRIDSVHSRIGVGAWGMRRRKYFLRIFVLASVLICGLGGHWTSWLQFAFAEEDAATALQHCDALASHPHDPGRYSAGVADAQFAPGAAIEACEPAVRLNPDVARAWFELGRSYWIGQRDKEAFKAFVEAAKRNYAPAMKYIGDAYLEGRGLPSGQKQNEQTALQWYKKSGDGGFSDGTKAAAEVNADIDKEKFDSSIFQDEKFMSALYYSTLTNADKNRFIFYVVGFVKQMKEKVFFLQDGSTCAPLISGAADTRIGLATVGAMEGMPNFLVEMSNNQERGERDALILFNRYGCNSAVTHTIMDHLNAMFDPRKQGLAKPQPSQGERATQDADVASAIMVVCEDFNCNGKSVDLRRGTRVKILKIFEDKVVYENSMVYIEYYYNNKVVYGYTNIRYINFQKNRSN
jgi:hypothetical protein